MKVGDWVFFKTHNWPKDVRYTASDPATGRCKDITGQGLYEGRGKIIGIAGDNYTVREEKSNRLVEVGPDPKDVIRPLGFEASPSWHTRRVGKWWKSTFPLKIARGKCGISPSRSCPMMSSASRQCVNVTISEISRLQWGQIVAAHKKARCSITVQVLRQGMEFHIGKSTDTVAYCQIALNDMLQMNPHQLDAAKKLEQSRMGIYEQTGKDGPHIRLRERITDDNFVCHCPAGYVGKKGELWFVRLLPPLEPQLAQY